MFNNKMDDGSEERYKAMAQKYSVTENSVQDQVFRNVSISSLNRWLGKISTNIDVSNLEYEISQLNNQIDELYSLHIKPLKEKIKKLELDIQTIKNNPSTNKNTVRIEKIILQAANQDPDNIVINAKNILMGAKGNDLTVNLNMIDELTDSEKTELYEQYVYEFKIMAGII